MCSEIARTLWEKGYSLFFTHETTERIHKPQGIEKDNFIKAIKLNPKYTFSDFVVGKNNNFAHSAAMAVAEIQGAKYNPLFLYGESGMGKTHLMQAIGHFMYEEFRNQNICYITTEQFMNEMVDAILKGTTLQFKNTYRNFDLLMIDDIHFMSNKDGLQTEIFHTFNALSQSNKQIVLTSDRPPLEIPDLDNRLVSRFQSGLLADLKNPDFETRVAILKKKIVTENLSLSDDIIYFIAENISQNVRELESSLIKILAYSSCMNIAPENIDLQTIADILSAMIKHKQVEVNLKTIFDKVCSFYKINPKDILDKTRKQHIAFPRQIAMYLSSHLIPSVSLKEVALYYNRNDHTTVIHAKRLIEKKSKEDNNFRMEIEKLIKEADASELALLIIVQTLGQEVETLKDEIEALKTTDPDPKPNIFFGFYMMCAGGGLFFAASIMMVVATRRRS
jgi:chromosomal replication initiator protein